MKSVLFLLLLITNAHSEGNSSNLLKEHYYENESTEKVKGKRIDLKCGYKSKQVEISFREGKLENGLFNAEVEGSKDRLSLGLTLLKKQKSNEKIIYNYKTNLEGWKFILVSSDELPNAYIGLVEIKNKNNIIMTCYQKNRLDGFSDTVKGALKKLPVERHAKILASKIAKTLPQKTDANTLIYQVIADGRTVVIYKQYLPSELESVEVYNNLLATIRGDLEDSRRLALDVQAAHSCSDSFGKGFIKNGGYFKFIWKDSNYENIFEFIINENNCK